MGERKQRLMKISNALNSARILTINSDVQSLADLDAELVNALDALRWLIEYPDTLTEQFAALEHHQWVEWSKIVMHEVSEERRKRWRKLQVPYDEVPITHKSSDRAWAKEVIDIFKRGWADLRTRE